MTRGASLLAVLHGGAVAVVAAVTADIRSVIPGACMMKVNAALGFCLLGVALWHAGEGASKTLRSRLVAHLCALAVALLAAITLVEYGGGRDLGIDQVLVRDTSSRGDVAPPGRMSPLTALNFLLLAVALLLREVEVRGRWPSHWLASTALFIAGVGLVGHLYGVPRFEVFGMASWMSLTTALLFLALGAGLLATRPDRGFLAILRGAGPGGAMARRLLPVIVLTPVVLGALTLAGHRTGAYGPDMAATLRTVIGVALCVAVVWWNARLLDKEDAELQASERRCDRMEAERERMRDAMIQSEKLASLGVLGAGIAHEINNPMACVVNNLHVVGRDVRAVLSILDVYERSREALAKVDPEAAARARELAEAIDLDYARGAIERSLDHARDGVKRVTSIVESLRSLSRAERAEMTEADLDEMVRASLEFIRDRLERRGIKVELDCAAAPRVRCVPALMIQAILNLVTNAMHAVEAAGRPDGGLIRIVSRRERDEQIIEVTDNGCGIPAENVPRLFDPFFTTKPTGEGTGLGLSVTHSIIAGQGGRIEVESRVGEGTCFRILLPLRPSGDG